MSVLLWLNRWIGKASDEQLMMHFAETRAAEILNVLFKKYSRDLYLFLLSLSNPDMAQDAEQSTWVKVIERCKQFCQQYHFKGWLFTLGRNQLIDEFRRMQRWQTIAIEEAEPELMQSEIDSLQQSCFQQNFERLLGKLPFLQKEAFVLQQEGFSLQQIAEITDSNQETVKSRLRHARAFFKKHLEASNDF